MKKYLVKHIASNTYYVKESSKDLSVYIGTSTSIDSVIGFVKVLQEIHNLSELQDLKNESELNSLEN